MLLKILIAIVLWSNIVLATNKADRAITELLAWEDVEMADDISDMTQAALMISPFAFSYFSENRVENLRFSAIMTGANYGLTSLVKFVVDRDRPNRENKHSFFSAHTSSSFVGASVSCRINRKACIPGYGLASLVAYLRVAARKHWLSDVLVGGYVAVIHEGYMANLVFRI